MNTSTTIEIDNLTPRIAVKAARLSLAKISPFGRHGDALADALEALDALADVVDGKAPARRIGDGIEADFELTDESDPETWPAWTDVPVELLALSLPPISGGAPTYEPTPDDWLDYEVTFLDHLAEIADGIELDAHPLSERDVITATGSF